MATATAPRPRANQPLDRSLAVLAVAGASLCVALTVLLAAGHVAGSGPKALAAAGFLLLVGWCSTHRRVDRTLAALGLYLGLLDGYVKLSTGNSTITLARDVLVMAIAAGALFRTMRTDQSLALPPLGGIVVAFSAVVFIELFNPQGRGLAGGLAGVRQHLEFVPLFFLGYVYLRRPSQLRSLLLILVVCAAAGGVVSYIQSTLTPEQFAGWGAGYRERIFGNGVFLGAARVGFLGDFASVRPFGLGSDVGGGALAAALALPALIALAMSARGKLRLALIPLAAGMALAIATSGSRTGLITVFVSTVAFGIIAAGSRNALRVVIGLAVGAVLVYGAFDYLASDNSATQRTLTIVSPDALSTYSTERGHSALLFGQYAVQYPLGVGVGSVGPAASAFSDKSAVLPSLDSETGWNFLILETGLTGLALYLALNVKLLSLALTRIRRIEDQQLRIQLAALAAPLVGLLVQGFAGPTTASVPSAPYLWLVSGVLAYWLVSRVRDRVIRV